MPDPWPAARHAYLPRYALRALALRPIRSLGPRCAGLLALAGNGLSGTVPTQLGNMNHLSRCSLSAGFNDVFESYNNFDCPYPNASIGHACPEGTAGWCTHPPSPPSFPPAPPPEVTNAALGALYAALGGENWGCLSTSDFSNPEGQERSNGWLSGVPAVPHCHRLLE